MGKSQNISAKSATAAGAPGSRLSRYPWLTLISAFLGWMFDSVDLNLLRLVLVPGVGQLLHSPPAAEISKVDNLIIWGNSAAV